MEDPHRVTVPIMAWYGDTELELDLPESWDVTLCVMKGHYTPPLSDREIGTAFANPIGTKTIRELAKGKKEVVILFDDMARPTPSAKLVPYVLEELAAAGIADDNIRFIAATGAHGSMNGIDFRKKLGDEVMGRFLVFNHNPYENCTYLGETSQGIPVSINSEFMSCDLKIGIGCIVPHPYGFGGGSKIVLPGIASMDSIHANHAKLRLSPTARMGRYEGNVLLRDMEEAAKMSALDVKIDAILNLRREVTALFVGDPVEEHREGVKMAREHYATDPVSDVDIVIANCYSKANEMLLAPGVVSPLLSPRGGDMVLIVVTPEGQINHYWLRSYGKYIGGRDWQAPKGLPPNTKRLTVLAPYPDKVGGDWLAPYDCINWTRTWPEVIQKLKRRYSQGAKVAVVPDATVQYFPDALGVEAGDRWLKGPDASPREC